MAAIAVTATVVSLCGAQEVAAAAATSTSRWEISVHRLSPLHDAPTVLQLLEPLRHPASPRLVPWSVTPLRRLRAAARISGILASVQARVGLLRRNVSVRAHYRVLQNLAIELRSVAGHLPPTARAAYRNVGNRIRRIAKRGIKSGGFPARRTRHHLRGLSAAIARRLSECINLA
jgi:hypothetical protein